MVGTSVAILGYKYHTYYMDKRAQQIDVHPVLIKARKVLKKGRFVYEDGQGMVESIEGKVYERWRGGKEPVMGLDSKIVMLKGRERHALWSLVDRAREGLQSTAFQGGDLRVPHASERHVYGFLYAGDGGLDGLVRQTRGVYFFHQVIYSIPADPSAAASPDSPPTAFNIYPGPEHRDANITIPTGPRVIFKYYNPREGNLWLLSGEGEIMRIGTKGKQRGKGLIVQRLGGVITGVYVLRSTERNGLGPLSAPIPNGASNANANGGLLPVSKAKSGKGEAGFEANMVIVPQLDELLVQVEGRGWCLIPLQS